MDWNALNDLARAQYGVLRLTDGMAHGITPSGLLNHARRHAWDHPVAGLVVVPGAPASFQQRAMIAVLALDGVVAVARRSAAYLHGIVERAPGTIDVLVPYGRTSRPPPEGVVLHRTRQLRPTDVDAGSRIPVTSSARTLVDLAAEESLAGLRSLVIDARQRGLVELGQIAAVRERVKKVKGIRKVDQVLMDLDAESCDSRLEWEFRQLLASVGLRAYPAPFPYRCANGRVLHIDVALADHWIACECDGYGSHSQRRHLEIDHVRQNLLVEEGWRPYRVDWGRLSRDPGGVVADLRRLIVTSPRREPARPYLG